MLRKLSIIFIRLAPVLLAVKILILLLSLFGIADMWEAVFADVGTTLITIVNTLRILRKYRKR